VSGKRKQLLGLSAQLVNVRKATAPLQKHLGVAVREQVREQEATPARLPCSALREPLNFPGEGWAVGVLRAITLRFMGMDSTDQAKGVGQAASGAVVHPLLAASSGDGGVCRTHPGGDHRPRFRGGGICGACGAGRRRRWGSERCRRRGGSNRGGGAREQALQAHARRRTRGVY
jgi:hypothetical protein